MKTPPLEIVCEIYGVDVSHEDAKRFEDALQTLGAEVFGQRVRGLWVHEGVFGSRHPRNVVCPRCDVSPGTPCRDLRVKGRFEALPQGSFHPERHEAARNL